jgi:iron(III) transport system substrate-binding protein
MINFKRSIWIAAAVAALVLIVPARRSSAQSDWKKEWEKTLDATKKEGPFTIYFYRYGRLVEEFSKDYPWIKPIVVSGRGSQLTTRIISERRAGKFIVDLFSGGANGNFNVLYKGKVLDPIKDALILPEVVDQSKWYQGEHRYADPDGKYIFAYLANPSSSQLSYNTTLLNPKEFKSHWDLTNPKWKGKIVALDPRDTGLGATMQFLYFQPELGPEFVRKFFGAMDITFSKNFRQMTDWLAQGKFAICMGCKDSLRAKGQGLPVDDFVTNMWKEGGSFSTGGGSISLLNQAPHPNAAKVFINWFLSRKGQMALQKLGDPDDPPNSRRIDIPKEDVPMDSRLHEGGKYFDVVRPEFADMKPIFDLAKEIMQANERKR